MKPLLALALFTPITAGLSANTIETAIVAAMKLSEVPNYSWICTVIDDAQTYDIEGKTQRNGYTWQRQPMPKSIVRRLGREADRELEAIFFGPSRYVIRTDSDWKTFSELPKRRDAWYDQPDWIFISTPISRTADMSADENDVHAFGLPPVIFIPILRERDPNRAYSNAQFALALPHEELAVIVSSHDEFVVAGDIVTGSLTDLGAQLLLVRDGHEYITPIIGDGRFTLWIADEAVTRYSVELAGIVVVAKKPIYVRQKSTTVIHHIGSTDFDVPKIAQRKLAR